MKDGHRKKWPFFLILHMIYAFLFRGMRLLYLLFIVFFSLRPAYSMDPLGDSILFAFDKCRTITVNLDKLALEESNSPAFDIHCVNDSLNKLNFKCLFYDPGSNIKRSQEALQGGKIEKRGELSNQGGTRLYFSLEKGTAAFDSPLASSPKENPSRKICAGVFIFEKDALKRKK